MILIQNFLNNEFVNGSAAKTQRFNPWTEDLSYEVTESNAMDFVKALQGVKEAQEKFRKLSIDDRAQILQRFAEKIYEKKAEIVKAEAQDEGLPEKFCFDEIVDPAQKYIENLSLEVRLFPKPDLISPTGIIAISGPRSLAFLYQAQWVANAIAAGNGVILKPNSDLPASANRLAEILQTLDLPKGLVQIIHGSDEELNQLLAGHPGISGFLFSGKFASAENLMIEVAKRKKKSQFFLGAKNSSIILPDFDFKSNIDSVLKSAVVGAGQLDVNTHRFFVTQEHEKEFYDAVQNHLDKMERTPILNQQRKDDFQKAVERVVPEEGKILTRGLPTFTRDLPNCSDLQQDQILGPLFLITAVKYSFDMVKWTNTGFLGHSAVIWGPEDKARKMAGQLNVGQVMINNWSDFSDWALPTKQSFWGFADKKWSGSFYCDVKKVLPL